MAEAIVRGVLAAQVLRPWQIIAADPSVDRRELFATQMGINMVAANAEAVADADAVLLSVKPQQMAAVLDELKPTLPASALVISIAAGISTGFIQDRLGGRRRVVRVMPNTPMLVGKGMAALSRGQFASEQDVAQVRRLLEAAATVMEVEESKLDAVTAVSGSGPAYFFFLVEYMVSAGQQLGLSEREAHTLAVTTALGAAQMLVESGQSPQELRTKVTSPGGTTQAAIQTLQARQMPEAIIEALQRAAQRSRELGK
jgi:pyrroline-5-carboxylate reductase